MSRATKMSGIRVFSPSSSQHDIITNVVYRELLDVHDLPPVSIPIRIIEVSDSRPDDDNSSESSYDDY
jgi:hypothetical protein